MPDLYGETPHAETTYVETVPPLHEEIILEEKTPVLKVTTVEDVRNIVGSAFREFLETIKREKAKGGRVPPKVIKLPLWLEGRIREDRLSGPFSVAGIASEVLKEEFGVSDPSERFDNIPHIKINLCSRCDTRRTFTLTFSYRE